MKQLFNGSRFVVATIMLLFLSTFAMGQRVNEMSGNISVLKGVKKINVKYDYSNMTVGKKAEQDYVESKKDGYNKKEPGKGDKWAKDWVADRIAKYEPGFEDGFNKNGDIQAGYFPKEKYTIIFKTVVTEPGFNIGITRKNSFIDGEAWIVETANPDNPIAKLSIDNCPGRAILGDDYDTDERIQEAYVAAGKGLARYFNRNIQ